MDVIGFDLFGIKVNLFFGFVKEVYVFFMEGVFVIKVSVVYYII